MFGFGLEYQGAAFWLPLIWAALIAVAVAMYVVMAGFGLAYAVLLPALYIPLFAMLIALIFRGVAFEFRFKAETSKRIWDYAFHYGSLAATFAQGVVLGAFVQGFPNDGRAFTGGTWDFLSIFSVMTGVSLVLGYGLLGATWCVMKTTGELELWARRVAGRFLIGVLLALG